MKNKLVKEILKCVVVLCSIAIISGSLLGLVNQITFVSEDEVIARAMSEKFPEAINVKPVVEGDVKLFSATDKNTKESFYIGMASSDKGYNGNVTMYVKIVDGNIVSVLEGANLETFKEPFGADFLAKFKKNLNDIKGFSLTGEGGKVKIDKVNGVTKSSTAITEAIDKSALAYKEYKAGGR